MKCIQLNLLLPPFIMNNNRCVCNDFKITNYIQSPRYILAKSATVYNHVLSDFIKHHYVTELLIKYTSREITSQG